MIYRELECCFRSLKQHYEKDRAASVFLEKTGSIPELRITIPFEIRNYRDFFQRIYYETHRFFHYFKNTFNAYSTYELKFTPDAEKALFIKIATQIKKDLEKESENKQLLKLLENENCVTKNAHFHLYQQGTFISLWIQLNYTIEKPLFLFTKAGEIFIEIKTYLNLDKNTKTAYITLDENSLKATFTKNYAVEMYLNARNELSKLIRFIEENISQKNYISREDVQQFIRKEKFEYAHLIEKLINSSFAEETIATLKFWDAVGKIYNLENNTFQKFLHIILLLQ